MKSLNRMIMEELVERLRHFDGNRSAAARSLKISIKTFANWMKKIRDHHHDLYQNVKAPSNAPTKKEMVSAKSKSKEEDYCCIGVFPTNEERIEYLDEMANRTHL